MAVAAAAFILSFKDSKELSFFTLSTAMSLHILKAKAVPPQVVVSM